MYVPGAKLDVFGNISVNGLEIINQSGMWVGDPTGLMGPEGPQGATGEQGPPGPPATNITPIIWSGGSTTHGQASGWNIYRTDGVDFNTSEGYLSVAGNGTITVLIGGFYVKSC